MVISRFQQKLSRKSQKTAQAAKYSSKISNNFNVLINSSISIWESALQSITLLGRVSYIPSAAGPAGRDTQADRGLWGSTPNRSVRVNQHSTVRIWRRSLPLQRPDIPHHKVRSPKGVEDAIDRKLGDLFDHWRKLTDEILSELTERYEIGESVFLGKAIPFLIRSIQSNEYYSVLIPSIVANNSGGRLTATIAVRTNYVCRSIYLTCRPLPQ